MAASKCGGSAAERLPSKENEDCTNLEGLERENRILPVNVQSNTAQHNWGTPNRATVQERTEKQANTDCQTRAVLVTG